MLSLMQVLLIRFASSPVAFLAALLLLPLAGMILFQSLAGALLGLLPPLLHLAGALLLRRAHPALVEALSQDLVERGLALCEAGPHGRRFTLIEPEGTFRIPLAGTLAARLKAVVLAPKESSMVVARLEGDVFPPRCWTPLEFVIREQGCLEVYLREVTHVETAPGGMVLHTTGSARIEIPDARDESGRASEYLRARLRDLGAP